MYEHGKRDLPCLDCPTRWNSTLEMYQEALKVKNILLCTMSDNNYIDLQEKCVMVMIGITILAWSNGWNVLLIYLLIEVGQSTPLS